jgi:Flp pilus assembly protein TadD
VPDPAASYTLTMPSAPRSDSVFTLYRRGIELLEEEDFAEAAEPLKEAARRAPEKTSIREALGRAYFRSGRFAAAAIEFRAVVERHQVNDYAHFCLGRALAKTGETERARHHLALASNLRPDRTDYSFYRAMLGA